MRGTLLISAGFIAMAITSAASAQGQTRRTPDQIVCEITGDCAGQVQLSESQMLEKGATAGFSFTRPGSKPAATAAYAPTRPTFANVRQPQPTGPKFSKSRSAAADGAREERRTTEMRVNFALGSAEILPDSRQEIENFAKALQSAKLSGQRFMVAGHTDVTGAPDRNLKLSQERADAVATFLRSQGIDSARLETRGFGFDKPLPGRGRASAQNRRVELVPIG